MKLKKTNHNIYKIVGNGAISSEFFGEGRLYPGLLIDVQDNKEISEYIEYHQTTPPGDVELTWAKTIFSKIIVLNIEFLKPMQLLVFGIEFDTSEHYSLIDGIIHSRGFYLQIGKKGDKFTNLIIPKLMIEVPDLGIDKDWEKILFETLKSIYLKRHFPKNDAIIAAKNQIKTMREIWNIRRKEN